MTQLFKDFKMPRKSYWQTGFMMMLKAPQGVVNIQYELDDHRRFPSDCRKANDWDKLPCGCKLAIGNRGQLNVDVGDHENPDLITNCLNEDDRTFLDCFLIAFRWYWVSYGVHDPRLHTSWYKEVENSG